ncbi:predicted protein [Botrytis cinerea T4]|uniref:Uncharacterized protein n=1 Tax=Botryotinia fuckeliana (strain T4) TaxID=999810 RepID=G2YYX0_BOTF4|nr:predicted protein [Botrytis cinerea T4]
MAICCVEIRGKNLCDGCKVAKRKSREREYPLRCYSQVFPSTEKALESLTSHRNQERKCSRKHCDLDLPKSA